MKKVVLLIINSSRLCPCGRHKKAPYCRFGNKEHFLLYCLTVVYDRCGVKEQRIVCFRKVNQLSERGRRDIADIDKRYFGIARSKKRRYTAAELIPENDEPAFFCGIRICDPDDRARAAEEHFIRIASGGGIEIVNRDVGRCFGIIHLKPPNHGVVEIEKALRCVRQG